MLPALLPVARADEGAATDVLPYAPRPMGGALRWGNVAEINGSDAAASSASSVSCEGTGRLAAPGNVPRVTLSVRKLFRGVGCALVGRPPGGGLSGGAGRMWADAGRSISR